MYYKVYYQLHKIDGDVTSKKVTTVSGTASTVTQTISLAADHLAMLLVVEESEGELVWHQNHDYTLQAGCTGMMADGREDVEVVAQLWFAAAGDMVDAGHEILQDLVRVAEW